MSSPVIVRVSHRYTAAAERVFDAWITPNQAARFLFATRTGNIMQCEMNARVGGAFTVTDRRPNADGEDSVFDCIHRGTFVEIARPRRLVFDFYVMPWAEDTTRVAIEIQSLSPMSCELTIAHDLGSGAEAQAMEAASRKGWTNMLCGLEREIFPRRVGIHL